MYALPMDWLLLLELGIGVISKNELAGKGI
jgi:hypothetical protein